MKQKKITSKVKLLLVCTFDYDFDSVRIVKSYLKFLEVHKYFRESKPVEKSRVPSSSQGEATCP